MLFILVGLYGVDVIHANIVSVNAYKRNELRLMPNFIERRSVHDTSSNSRSIDFLQIGNGDVDEISIARSVAKKEVTSWHAGMPFEKFHVLSFTRFALVGTFGIDEIIPWNKFCINKQSARWSVSDILEDHCESNCVVAFGCDNYIGCSNPRSLLQKSCLGGSPGRVGRYFDWSVNLLHFPQLAVEDNSGYERKDDSEEKAPNRPLLAPLLSIFGAFFLFAIGF